MASKRKGGGPRRPVPIGHIDVRVWEERDRLHIHAVDTRDESTIAEWWDEDARQMIEDGFFEPGRKLTDSVIAYLSHVGLAGVVRSNPAGERFVVSVWHGENGSIATVIDSKTENVMGYYSTVRDGADWLDGAKRQAAALNKGTTRKGPLKLGGKMKAIPLREEDRENPSAYVRAMYPDDDREPYGWVITKDHLHSAETPRDDAGVMGPRNIPPEIEKQLDAGKGKAFRMLDDDRNVYYSGRYIGPDDETLFAPLEDFGTPNAGAVIIQYREGGKWADL